MPTVIYSPLATVRIRTAPESRGKGKIIDVTEDVSSGRISRITNGISSSSISLLNQSRKYDGMFSPMDAVVIYLRRFKTVLKFSGYLDDVPKWSALPGSININASCTMKRLANFYWDPGSPEAAMLLSPPTEHQQQMQDAGLADRAIRILTEVVEWPKSQIHISRVPSNWYDKIASVADELISEAEAIQMAETVGSGAWVGGDNPIEEGTSRIDGIGPGTGVLPNPQGRISHFGGPGGGAYGNMALTGESGVNPRDPWYVAMRWPYTNDNAVAGAKQWWVNRKILVVNPKNNKSVVLRAADWGPHVSTGRVIDVSPRALKALGANTDDTVNIAFAPPKANLGPVSRDDAGLGATVSTATGGSSLGSASSSPNPVTSGWGSAGNTANIVSATAAGITFQVHRLAKEKFEGFVSDLVATYGYQPKSIGGYNNRNIAGSSTKSNHAWGAAIDIDPTENPYYSSGSGGSYALPKGKGLVALARKWGLGWGGEWRNSKDYMHFEVLGAPSSGDYPNVAPAKGGRVAKWKPPIRGDYTVTARFGEKGANWAKYHSGTDFSAPAGTAIHPVGPGQVHDKGSGDSSYGNWIAIDHGNKVYTFYAHMEAPSPLSVGNQVDTGDVLGGVGATGNVTGVHLHLELRKGANTYDAALKSGGIEKYILGGKNRADPPAGTQAVTDVEDSPDLSMEDIGRGLFNVFQYHAYAPSEGGTLLGGYRALLNDRPVSLSIEELMTAAQRQYCSAPNGDFIAWFPDYFGHFKQAGKMVVTPLEINGVTGPPTIGWSDRNLKTHMFVTGSSSPGANNAGEVWRQATSAGIASIEFPELMMALLNINRKEAETLRDVYLSRYGARPEHVAMNEITGARQEFFFACHLFMQQWVKQYSAKIDLMFMPELYPGMLLCIPEYGIQGYVTETTDNWDYQNGFTTTVTCAPWSALGPDGAKKAMAKDLPMGAPL